MSSFRITYLVVLCFLITGASYSQPASRVEQVLEHFRISRPDTTLQLTPSLIIPNSESVYLDSLLLERNIDYTLDPVSRVLKIHVKNIHESPFKEHAFYFLSNALPFSFKAIYRHRDIVFRSDSSGTKNASVISAASTSGALGDFFGPELQKSGSIFRGFTVGSNRDFTVNSGFRLQFAGKLSSDVEILAALTDENTPIQPEGNTQTLQELDNVFVEIKSTNYEATLGDFYVDIGNSEFTRLNRKLQGAKGTGLYRSNSVSSALTVVGASSRGKFNTNQISGIEGVQGPYRLFGKNNERTIVVIAGTEKVWVDGVLMIRGEANDYSIDYGGSEITFNSKRLITGISRIIVDFQYTDQAFTRNFFAVQSDDELFSGKLKLSAMYAREGDDPNAPIDVTLSEDDKRILGASGSSTAFRSGVDSVGIDSLNIGRGQYSAVDSTIQGVATRFYRYSPGVMAAQFNVTFTFVGSGGGDYIRESLGQYSYVGPHNGQYLPIVVLPSPQLQQLAAVSGSGQIAKGLTVTGEYAASNTDANRFSTVAARTGGAMKFTTAFKPENVSIAGHSIGSFDLTLSERYIDRNFQALDRVDEVEFGRKWSLDSTVSLQPSSEEIREAQVVYRPANAISVGASTGSNDRGRQFSANRNEAFFRIAGDSLPSAEYSIENITSSQLSLPGQNDWLRQHGSLAYTFGSMTPAFRFETEDRSIVTPTSDSIDAASFGFTTLAPKITLKSFYGMNLSGEVEVRDDKSAYQGKIEPQARSITQSYEWTLPETQSISSSLNVITRKKTYRDQFRLLNGDVQTTLVREQTRYAPYRRSVDADVFYEASTRRSPRLERVFYKVQKGEGQYIWSDGNGNGRFDATDERDFQLSRYDGEYVILTVPSDQLFPVIDLKTSARLRLTPSRFLGTPATWLEKTLNALSTETFVRIEENSSIADTRKIYLMHLSNFLDPATTILGSQLFQHDFFVFENRSDISIRGRYIQRKGVGQYSSGVEQSYNRERSLRLRLQLVSEISNQIEYANKDDALVAPPASGRSRSITTDDLSSDYSYRPEQNVEVGFKFEVAGSQDRFPSTPISSFLNSQSLRTTFSFQGAGQARFELSREEIILENFPAGAPLSYELTGGRSQGKTFLWGVTFDYKISNNLQSSLQYSGRSEQGHPAIHSARAEVRAFF